MLTRGGGSERFLGGMVTFGTFQFLGMRPFLGRVLEPEDFSSGTPPVFIMRYRTWLARFGGDHSIVNRAFFLNGKPYTLIGIMPPRFALGNRDIWMPVQGFADPPRRATRSCRWRRGGNAWPGPRRLLRFRRQGHP